VKQAKKLFEVSIRKAREPLYVVSVGAINKELAKWIACAQENVTEKQIVEVN
jgi:hypothetical protein